MTDNVHYSKDVLRNNRVTNKVNSTFIGHSNRLQYQQTKSIATRFATIQLMVLIEGTYTNEARPLVLQTIQLLMEVKLF